MRRICAVVILCAGTAVSLHAQWFDRPAAGVPSIPMKDGKPDLTARAPRTADGKPDLSGVWTTDATPVEELERLFPGLGDLAVPGDDPRFFPKFFLNVFSDFKRDEVPLKPEGAKILMQRIKEGFGKEVPTSHCLPAGIPMGDLLPAPRRFIQIPGLLVILYDGINPHRLIYTDGRALPVDPVPTWMGYAVGRWEGDTLVVESRGYNDRTWLDATGHPRTEAMRIVERIHRRDFGHADVQVTFDDPGVYTKPFSIRYTMTQRPHDDVIEAVCAENEKDRAHIK